MTDTGAKCQLTDNNRLGQTIRGSLGLGTLSKPGTSLDVRPCVGRRYWITVENGPKGGKASVTNVTCPPPAN